jgi:hypothetical protein
MRVLLPLKKKGIHQHQHLEDQQEEGEEQHLELQQQQEAEEASHSYTEAGSEPTTTPSSASALSVEPAPASTALAAAASSAVSVPIAAPASPRSLLATSSSYKELSEPSKKRARTESASEHGNSKPAARRSASDLVTPVLPVPSGNSNHTEAHTHTMAGGRYPPHPDDGNGEGDDDDWQHQGFFSTSATAAATRASLTTDSTPTSSPTATAVATTLLENEAPPNNDSNESNMHKNSNSNTNTNTNNIYLNYQITDNTHGSNTTSSNNSQAVARSAASASNRSNDPAIDTADGNNNKVNDDQEVSEAFRRDLKKQGLEIVEQEGDGNCLFRAVSLQVYGDSSMHEDVRQQCLDFMARDVEHFGQFVVGEDFGAYIARKRQDGVHGNHTEIQAVSELFNRPVEVFTPASAAKPLNIFHAEYKTADAPIRLSYHDGNHYNAVIDPLVPTAGLGLGLPGLKPGLADQMQVAKAVTESDQLADDMELERVLKESARDNDDLQRALKESAYDSKMQMDKVSLQVDG